MVPAATQGVFTADLSETELLVGVRLSRPGRTAPAGRCGSCPAATATSPSSAWCAVELDEDGAFAGAALSYFGVAGQPMVADAEAALIGSGLARRRTPMPPGSSPESWTPAADPARIVVPLRADRRSAGRAEASDRAVSARRAERSRGKDYRDPQHHVEGQRDRAHCGSGRPPAPGRCAARGAQPIGTHLGCEHGAQRCPARSRWTVRRPGPACPCGVGRRQRDHHDRGPDRGRRLDGPHPAGDVGAPRIPVRVLRSRRMMLGPTMLAENPEPTAEDSRRVCRATWCRCTGYHSILEGGTRRWPSSPSRRGRRG